MPDSTAVQYGQGWGQSYEDLTLPSGAVCQVRKLQMEDLVDLNIVDQMDFLGQVVEDEHVSRVKATGKTPSKQTKKPTKAEQAAKEQEEADNILKDPKKFRSMINMVDKIVVACVVQPPLVDAYFETVDGAREKLSADERIEGRIYSDSIGFEDKMEIFSTVFSGVNKMSGFREGSGEAVGDVDSVSEDEVQAE